MRLSLPFCSVVIGSLWLLGGCAGSVFYPSSKTEIELGQQEVQTQTQLNVVVSLLPQKYFVEKIGGDRLNVSVMVGAGAEAESYEPKPQQLKTLSDADAYIGIGGTFESVWKQRIIDANPQLAFIDSSVGVQRITMAAHHHHDATESDVHRNENNETGLDPHIWLSPRKGKIQAQNIAAALIELDPDHAEVYQQNLDRFLAEIDQLDQEIQAKLSNLTYRKFIVFHPAWGYFAEDYGLEQIPMEVGGQEPSAAELAELIQIAQAENIRIIFAQYQFNSQDAQTIAQEIQGEVVYIDPLAPNWSENLRQVAEQFASMGTHDE